MECDRFREAVSARIDGEDPGLPDGALEAHLAGLRRLPRLAAAGARDDAPRPARRLFLDHDLTARVLAAVPRPPATGRRPAGWPSGPGWSPWRLAQLAITVPLLILGHDHDAGTARRARARLVRPGAGHRVRRGRGPPGAVGRPRLAVRDRGGRADRNRRRRPDRRADPRRRRGPAPGRRGRARCCCLAGQDRQAQSAGTPRTGLRAEARSPPGAVPRPIAAVPADGSPGVPGGGDGSLVPQRRPPRRRRNAGWRRRREQAVA